jgi:glycosyltransferase involved in cell wall biosynthesis
MGYGLLEIELTEQLPQLEPKANENGFGLIVRWRGQLIGFEMLPMATSAELLLKRLEDLADRKFAERVLTAKVRDELSARWARPLFPPMPVLTVAICTRDRVQRLARLLASLNRIKMGCQFSSLEILVVDNASVDDTTRRVVKGFENARYIFEPRPGLNFARNAALNAASGDLIAYLDDDVVVDRNWLWGLAEAWRSRPDAGGFTGLVLPFRLDTDAQIYFESHGGFGRGFERKEFASQRFDNPLHPVGSGILGAGCNMAFDRALLIALGGFDEALDTGAPLPGGGDLDIFYRVLRAGYVIVYEPQYAVYHEHRETIAQLRRQYWSWGLGMMAFLVKSWRTDRELRSRHRAMVRWWLIDQAKGIARAVRRLSLRELQFGLAELWGGICGLVGGYDRSHARVRAIRDQHR